MDISIDSKLAPLTTLTLGGLMVNEETGEVLNQNHEEIKDYMLLEERLSEFAQIFMYLGSL